MIPSLEYPLRSRSRRQGHIHGNLLHLIKTIDCLGKKFDPNFHQAVSEEVNNNKESGEIIKVIQTGYLIKDRLLRPASVVIAKKGEDKKK